MGAHRGRRKPRKRRGRKRLVYGIITVVGIFAFFLVYSSLQSSLPNVAIVDHLSFFPEQRSPTFVDACIDILEADGLSWAYHKGEEVTVDFYRNLPSCGTNLIILRVHSAIMRTEEGTISILGLFTSERYNDEAAQKYREEIRDGQLVRAFFSEGGEEYFGIVPGFVEKRMKGEFKNTIVIMMGCEGLGYIETSMDARVTYTNMAEAFINKGAKVYIGWDGLVGMDHTDQATVQLLKSLIQHKRTIERAVAETMEIVDRDPAFDSALNYYPETAEAGNYTFRNLKSSLIINVISALLMAPVPTKTKYGEPGWFQSPAKTGSTQSAFQFSLSF